MRTANLQTWNFQSAIAPAREMILRRGGAGVEGPPVLVGALLSVAIYNFAKGSLGARQRSTSPLARSISQPMTENGQGGENA